MGRFILSSTKERGSIPPLVRVRLLVCGRKRALSVPWRPDQCVNMAIAQGDKVLLGPGFVCTAAVQMNDQSELSLQEITGPSVNSNHEAARVAELLDWRAFLAAPLIGAERR